MPDPPAPAAGKPELHGHGVSARRASAGSQGERAAWPSAPAGWPRSRRRDGSRAPEQQAEAGLRPALQRAAGGARRAASPGALGQEALHDPVLQRVEGHHREPAAGASSAFGGAQAGSSSPSSSLTAMRSAWKRRVSPGRVGAPRRPPHARSTSSASSSVRSNRRFARAATIAPAIRRDARSSP